jgi:hypothetical protein
VVGQPEDLVLPAGDHQLVDGGLVEVVATGPIGSELAQLGVDHAQIGPGEPDQRGARGRRQPVLPGAGEDPGPQRAGAQRLVLRAAAANR